LLLFFAHIIWWWYKYLVRIANMEDDSSRMFLRALVIMGMLCFSFIS
jgi:Kef-type K+ transport system membrane component KefB